MLCCFQNCSLFYWWPPWLWLRVGTVIRGILFSAYCPSTPFSRCSKKRIISFLQPVVISMIASNHCKRLNRSSALHLWQGAACHSGYSFWWIDLDCFPLRERQLHEFLASLPTIMYTVIPWWGGIFPTITIHTDELT